MLAIATTKEAKQKPPSKLSRLESKVMLAILTLIQQGLLTA